MTGKRTAWWTGWVLLGVVSGHAGAGDDEAARKAALKQVTKALVDVRGVVADVDYDEVVDARPIHGTGRLSVDFRGFMRAEIGGDEPRTVLFRPPHLYVYRPTRKSVEVDDVTTNADRLAQYLVVGFAPAGKAMTERYDVQLIANATLDEQPMLGFLLKPHAKKAKEAARSIARIQIWVDPATGFPVRQQVVHSSGLVELNARLRNATRDDALPDALFQPNWPPGTKVVPK